MKIKLQTIGSTTHSGEFDSKQIADYLMMNDSGRPDNGFYQEKVEANASEISRLIKAVFQGGTFMGFECDFYAVYDAIGA